MPEKPEPLFQEPGIRRSRALPYELHVDAQSQAALDMLILNFRNTGTVGAVLHVYDRLDLDRIPRPFTVEAGKTLMDDWRLHDDEGRYDLGVCGPNGFVREFRGTLCSDLKTAPDVELQYDVANSSIRILATSQTRLSVRANAYRTDGPWPLKAGRRVTCEWSVVASHNWYDLTVNGQHLERRFAGRMETGAPSFTDPAL